VSGLLSGALAALLAALAAFWTVREGSPVAGLIWAGVAVLACRAGWSARPWRGGGR
jgi:hypothetical protein